LTIAWLTEGDEDHDSFLFPVGTLARVTDPSGAVADIIGVIAGNRVSFTFANLALGRYTFEVIGGPSNFLFATGQVDVTPLNPQFPTPPWLEVGVRGEAWHPEWWDEQGSGGPPLPVIDEVVIADLEPADPAVELWVDLAATAPPGGGAPPAPAVVTPGVPLADWSTGGTVAFIVGSGAVTVSIEGVPYSGAVALPETVWTPLAPLPAGVPAPLTPLVQMIPHRDPSGGYNDPTLVRVDGTGVSVKSYTSRLMSAPAILDGTISWAV